MNSIGAEFVKTTSYTRSIALVDDERQKSTSHSVFFFESGSNHIHRVVFDRSVNYDLAAFLFDDFDEPRVLSATRINGRHI
jgi:hypothetical protein